MSEENLFKILEYQQRQLLDQHEKIDKWFRFYLLIIGAPFPILAVLLQTKYSIPYGNCYNFYKDYHNIIVLITLSFFIIGFFFFMINIYQRINTITIFFRKMIPIERKVYQYSFINKDELEKIMDVLNKTKPNWHGAEFWVRMAIIFINSLWFALFIYSITLLCKKPPDICNYIITIFGMLIIFAIQMIINSRLLTKHECKFGY